MRLTRPTRLSHGFTLVELMVVVAIVGVLATISVFGVRKYILSAKTAEATNMLGTIAAAEEEYRSEAFVYLGMSAFGDWHPMDEPSNFRYGWGLNTDDAMFASVLGPLGVQPAGAVAYSYGVVVGGVGAGAPTIPGTLTISGFPAPTTSPWYVIMAKADLDGDGRHTYMLTTSFNAGIAMQDNF